MLLPQGAQGPAGPPGPAGARGMPVRTVSFSTSTHVHSLFFSRNYFATSKPLNTELVSPSKSEIKI